MSQNRIKLPTTPPYSGLALVNDTNDALDTVASDFAGPVDPAAFAGPYMTWADTATGYLKRRNAGNTAWIVEQPLFQNIEFGNLVSLMASGSFITPPGKRFLEIFAWAGGGGGGGVGSASTIAAGGGGGGGYVHGIIRVAPGDIINCTIGTGGAPGGGGAAGGNGTSTLVGASMGAGGGVGGAPNGTGTGGAGGNASGGDVGVAGMPGGSGSVPMTGGAGVGGQGGSSPFGGSGGTGNSYQGGNGGFPGGGGAGRGTGNAGIGSPGAGGLIIFRF